MLVLTGSWRHEPGRQIINADAMGFNEGVNRGTSMGMNSYDASFNGTAESIARSAQARIGN